MKTLLATLMATVFLASAASAADTYKIDPTHSYVGFKVSHLGFSNMIGMFEEVSGEFTYDVENPSNSSVSVEVNTDSVNTNMAERDNHIRSADFLDVAVAPTASFKSTAIEVTGEHTAKITGDLTILGKTMPLVVDAEHVGGGSDPWGGVRQGFSGTAKLSMKELGVKMDLGPASDAVQLVIELEGIKQ
jgi:polyisoprenoid-binding protein YceI